MFLFEYEVSVFLPDDVRVVVPVSLEFPSHVVGLGVGVRDAERVAWDRLSGCVSLSNVSLGDLLEGHFMEVKVLGVRGGFAD